MRDAGHGAIGACLIILGTTTLPVVEAWMRVSSLAVGIIVGLLAIRSQLKTKK